MIRQPKGILLVAVCLLALPGTGSAQSLDEVIARHIQAKGGVQKLKAVQTIRQTSRMNMQGMEATVVVVGKRPNLLRQEMTMAGQRVINGFDGQSAWIVNPLVSPGGGAIRLTGPEAEITREQSNFDPPLLDYKEKGYRVELVGLETLGDRKVHHLRVTSPARVMPKPQVQHAYLDADTGLEVKLVTETESGRFEQELSDYRDVDGVKVPFLIRMLTNGVLQSEIKVEKVEFNVKVDDAIFMMPKK